MNKVANILFDFDGTLADTAQGVKESVAFALDSLSIAHSPITDDVVGPSPYYLYKTVFKLNENNAKKAVALHRKYSEQEAYKSAKIYDGVLQTLLTLQKCGIKLFIVSLKKESTIKKIISSNGLNSFFQQIIGVNRDETVSKTDLLRLIGSIIDFKETLYVGDTQADYECCKSIGLGFCFAEYGYGNIDDTCSCKIQSFKELVQLIKK